MGEILPNGTIQSYSTICPICEMTVNCNMQGEVFDHDCTENQNPGPENGTIDFSGFARMPKTGTR